MCQLKHMLLQYYMLLSLPPLKNNVIEDVAKMIRSNGIDLVWGMTSLEMMLTGAWQRHTKLWIARWQTGKLGNNPFRHQWYHNRVRVMGNVFKTNKKKYTLTYHTKELWDSLPQEVMKVRIINRLKMQSDKLMEKRPTRGYKIQQCGYSKILLAQTGRCWVAHQKDCLYLLCFATLSIPYSLLTVGS